jgi:DNA transformation protein and related proteins
VTPEAIQDLFEELGPVRCRRMFGGFGIYSGERIFGLATGGEIFLKSDAVNRPAFEKAGSRPFTFEKDGRLISTSYWLLPGAALDDPSEAARWGRSAIEASARKEKAPKKARLKPVRS